MSRWVLTGVVDTLRCWNVEPGDITEKNILSWDKEREAEKHRKSSIKFKKEHRQNYVKKKARNRSDVNKERVTHQSGVALTLEPQLLQRAIVTKEKLKEFEKDVPSLTNRPEKKVHYMPCRWFENEALRDNFIWYGDKLWRKGSWNNSISCSNWGQNWQTFSKVCPTEVSHFFPCFKSK